MAYKYAVHVVAKRVCFAEAIVDFDYTAKEPDELTIRKGDVIKEVVDMGGGWCQGVLGDKKGMFPDNFVKMVVPLR